MKLLNPFKRTLKPGQMTKREKQETIEMNPGYTSATTAKHMYYHAKHLPQSVLERKREFNRQEEIERRTQRLRDVSTYRKNKITKKKSTDSGEYGRDLSVLGRHQDIGSFLEGQNISTKKSSSARGVRKTRKHRKRHSKK